MNVAFLRRQSGKLALLVILVITTAVILVAYAHRVPDQVYEGKRLSEWLVIWGTARQKLSVDQRAHDAILHLGTNAVPSLLAWMDYETPLDRYPLLFKLCQHLPQSVMSSSPVQKALGSRKKQIQAQNATDAMQLLGPLANSAIPELSRRVTTSKPRAGRDDAMLVLSRLGQPAVPAMEFALRDETMAGNLGTVACLENLGTDATPLIPLIIQNLRHTNAEVARWNAFALGELKLRPDLAIPALAGRLKYPCREVRWTVADSLRKFGRLSQSALPALTNALADPDPDVAVNAARAISEITADPQPGQ